MAKIEGCDLRSRCGRQVKMYCILAAVGGKTGRDGLDKLSKIFRLCNFDCGMLKITEVKQCLGKTK